MSDFDIVGPIRLRQRCVIEIVIELIENHINLNFSIILKILSYKDH